jgi:hypothetical protein
MRAFGYKIGYFGFEIEPITPIFCRNHLEIRCYHEVRDGSGNQIGNDSQDDADGLY